MIADEHDQTDPASYDDGPGAPERRRRRGPGCLIALLVLALLLGGGYYGLTRGIDALESRFAPAPDYPGPGTGKVLFEVPEGASSAALGRSLKAQGVVKSVDAFVEAANSNPESRGIQVGFYELKKQMKATDALEILVNPDNLMQNVVVVPEGLTVDQIVEVLARNTDFSARKFRAVLEDPAAIGLPSYAQGNAEGYLFPATYNFPPNATPATMLSMMVERWRQAADAAGLEEAARRLGYTPHELMTVASLVEAEAKRDADRPKVARVIYNRIENPGTAGTSGRLQLDATVNYAADQDLGARPTTEDLEIDSPYNTYLYPGLPPGPIEAPGEAAIEAAAKPADGDWYYYVTVNLRTGETKFAETYDEFLGYKRELDEYCRTQSESC